MLPLTEQEAESLHHRRLPENLYVADATLLPRALGNPPINLAWSDDGSNLEYIKDALNNETFIEYNPLNSPTSIIDPLNYETRYFYTDPNFPTLPTRIEYPLSFDGGVTFIDTEYEYYPPSSGASAGKVKFITDALGNKTQYTYTSFGQTSTVTTAYNTSSALIGASNEQVHVSPSFLQADSHL